MRSDRLTTRAVALIAMLSAMPVVLRAQTGEPAAVPARFRLGPVGITPGISVSAGVDSNVLATESLPQDDVMMSVNPRVQTGLRMQRMTLDVRTSVSSVHYRELENQGGVNWSNDTRINLSLTHSVMSTQQRATYEIDARARHDETMVGAGADIRMTSRTSLRLGATRSKIEYGDDAFNLGVNLADSLNRRIDIATLALRYQLTGSTTFGLSGDAIREEFDLSPIRNSRSVRLTPGVEFDKYAIISGRAYAGYRRFTLTSGMAPTFTGPVAAVDLSSVIRGRTRLGLQLSRDVSYSYDVMTPYYLLTTGALSLSRRLGDRWEIVANGSKNILGYRSNRLLAIDPEPASPGLTIRRDYVYLYGGGLNYLFNDRVRCGVTAEHIRRDSDVPTHGYRATRVLAHLDYGM
jgi:hypothetical protein